MALEEPKFDVRVRAAPVITPDGEHFTTALARAFDVDLSVAGRITREAPTIVKRAVPLATAERLARVLRILGAEVEILVAGTIVDRPGLAPRATPFPSLPVGPISERPSPAPPPRPSYRASERPASQVSGMPSGLAAPSDRPFASVTLVPAPPRGFAVPPLLAVLGAVFAFGLTLGVVTHWIRRAGDGHALGTLPTEETPCRSHFGLTGPGLGTDAHAKLTLVVGWRSGCLRDDYRSFLEDIARHHRGEVAVFGAAIAAPGGRDPRGVGRPPEPPPDPWPPERCTPDFEVLPVSQGFVSDYASPSATYLFDEDGSLVAAWRGEPSVEQRARLTAWIDGRPWE